MTRMLRFLGAKVTFLRVFQQRGRMNVDGLKLLRTVGVCFGQSWSRATVWKLGDDRGYRVRWLSQADLIRDQEISSASAQPQRAAAPLDRKGRHPGFRKVSLR